MKQHPHFPDLILLNLLHNALHQLLRLPRPDATGREHLQRPLNPRSSILWRELEDGHEHGRGVREAVTGEAEHHPSQDALDQDRPQAGDELLHSRSDLSRVREWLSVGRVEFGYGRFIAPEAEKITKVVEGSRQRIDLLKGESAQSCFQNRPGILRCDCPLWEETDCVGRETEEVLDDCSLLSVVLQPTFVSKQTIRKLRRWEIIQDTKECHCLLLIEQIHSAARLIVHKFCSI